MADITLSLNADVLMARAAAMTSKAADISAATDGEHDMHVAQVQKITSSDVDKMLVMTALRVAIDSLFTFLSGEQFDVKTFSDTLTDSGGSFTITINKPPRFNDNLKQSLLSCFNDYIVNYMLYHWYGSFTNQALMTVHLGTLASLRQQIARCFRESEIPLATVTLKSIND